MPITTSAKKKMRRDLTKRSKNATQKTALKQAIKKTRREPSKETFVEVQKLIDKAAKNNLIHKNKAARLKSQLSKLVKKL